MAGVPFRSAELYLGKLLSKGYSVALCDQVGVVGATRGPVERRVTRVLTPGTVLESSLLPARENNYIAAILRGGDDGSLWGLAYADASCGEFCLTQLSAQQLILEVDRLNPREILVARRTAPLRAGQVVPQELLDLPEGMDPRARVTGRPAMFFQFEPARRRIMELFGITTLEGFGCQSLPLAVGAAGAIFEYLEKTQGSQMPKFPGLSTYAVEGYLVLDANTRKNLELVETSRERTFEGSLLWALDQTKTGMGSRTLRKWLLKPLYAVAPIEERQEAIRELIAEPDKRQTLASTLSALSDLERLGVRLSSGTILPKELSAVRQSLDALPPLTVALRDSRSPYLNVLSELSPALVELRNLIAAAIAEEAPREIT